MVRIKLCGLNRPEDVLAVNRLKPEYAGFIFAPKSKRFVSPKKAKELKALLSPSILAVGVFVNETPKNILALAEEGIIDCIQLHGEENPKEVRHLQTLTHCPVIQAFSIAGAEDVKQAMTSPAQYLLLDGGRGDGKAFDWKLLQEASRPFFLAGGLNPENVGEAIARVHPFGVDVSSGIETDGKKDVQRMAEFVAAVRKEANI